MSKEVLKQIEGNLISAGVKNLKEFGYPSVNNENIVTDTVYSEFFKSMLKDNLGKNKTVDIAIYNVLEKINSSVT